MYLSHFFEEKIPEFYFLLSVFLLGVLTPKTDILLSFINYPTSTSLKL